MRYRTQAFATRQLRNRSYRRSILLAACDVRQKGLDLKDYDKAEAEQQYEEFYKVPAPFIPYPHSSKTVTPHGFDRIYDTSAQKEVKAVKAWFDHRNLHVDGSVKPDRNDTASASFSPFPDVTGMQGDLASPEVHGKRAKYSLSPGLKHLALG
jgi:hypothetical protein